MNMTNRTWLKIYDGDSSIEVGCEEGIDGIIINNSGERVVLEDSEVYDLINHLKLLLLRRDQSRGED